MSILVNENSRIVVQGITGREGGNHARRCVEYGTKVVAGVTPGRGGTMWEDSVPVFNSINDAVREAGANVSLIFVPAPFAGDAILESADGGIGVIACITEGIPPQDMITINECIGGSGARLIGPNCPGVITPGARCKVGIMPGDIHTPGRVGVVSRSGTLTYEAVEQLSALGIGQSTCVGIGGDPVSGMSFVDVLSLFNDDPDTDMVVLIGEIGGTKEQDAAVRCVSPWPPWWSGRARRRASGWATRGPSSRAPRAAPARRPRHSWPPARRRSRRPPTSAPWPSRCWPG